MMRKLFYLITLLLLIPSCRTADIVVPEEPEVTVEVNTSPVYLYKYYYFDWETGRYIYGRRYYNRPPIYYHNPTPPPRPPKRPHVDPGRPQRPHDNHGGNVRPGNSGRPNNHGGRPGGNNRNNRPGNRRR